MNDISDQKQLEDELFISEERYRFLFENSGVAIGYYKPDGTVISYNKKAAENMGGQISDFLGKSIYELFPKEDANLYMDRITKAAESEGQQEYEDYVPLRSGSKWFTSTFCKILNSKGNVDGIQIVLQDITERKQVEEKIKESEGRLNSAQLMAHVGNWELDLETQTIWASEEAFNIYGMDYLPASPYLPLSFVQRAVLPEYREHMDKALAVLITKNKKYDEKYKIKKRNTGEERFVHTYAVLNINEIDNSRKVIGSILDITDYKNAENEIKFLGDHDQLTGMYNRRYYDEVLTQINDSNSVPVTLIVADVNGLKLTNDAFGHKSGDALLKRVAEVLVNESRAGDTVARIGGDEFVLILPETNAKNAEEIIDRISLAVRNEKINNLIPSISVGYAVKENIYDNINDVYKKAEDEMYRHKLFDSSSMRSKTVDLIMKTLFEKNEREMLHSERVSELCAELANKFGFGNYKTDQIKTAGLLHDIGKIGIDEKILNKAEKLSDEEWKEIKKHSEIGYRILSGVNEFSQIADFILAHHERWDGKGYPKGLEGEEIAIEARIIAIADSFDAMMSKRPYRKAFDEDEAIEEICKCAGTQFDPSLAKIFVDSIRNKELVFRTIAE